VIWRADLTEELLSKHEHAGVAASIVGAVRPSALEAISLPFASAKAWLSGADVGDITDVEGIESIDASAGTFDKPFLRWRGDTSEISQDLRPGDTIIVPAARGGICNECFDPSSREHVADLAEEASLLGRCRPVLRLQQAVLKNLKMTLPADVMDDASLARAALSDRAPSTSGWQKLWIERLARSRKRPIVVEALRDDSWLVLEAPKLKAAELRAAVDQQTTQEDGVDVTTDEEDSYFGGRLVTLSEHSSDVEHYARSYAQAIGLSELLTKDLALAAWLHDIGKADPRFQLLLFAGSEIELLKASGPLAKSAVTPADKSAQQFARTRSGYPNGARHEVQSLSMIDHHLEQVREHAHDIELVRYLVASHHGRCRPFAPVALDASPVDVQLEHTSAAFGTLHFAPVSSDNQLYRLDSGLADRFWKLVAKYGWLELCWLESILRLADHRASEAEQERES
jgi:CRISPR-associated endonuclease/helicase Cas3